MILMFPHNSGWHFQRIRQGLSFLSKGWCSSDVPMQWAVKQWTLYSILLKCSGGLWIFTAFVFDKMRQAKRNTEIHKHLDNFNKIQEFYKMWACSGTVQTEIHRRQQPVRDQRPILLRPSHLQPLNRQLWPDISFENAHRTSGWNVRIITYP